MTRDTDMLQHAPPGFDWPRVPLAEAFLKRHIEAFVNAHPLAARLAVRMQAETSTKLFDWVDHVVLPARATDFAELTELGFVPEDVQALLGCAPHWHPHAQLPRLVLDDQAQQVSVAIHVDSVADFLCANGLHAEIGGAPHGQYRCAVITEAGRNLVCVERRGYRGYVPDPEIPGSAYFSLRDAWHTRQRHFDDDSEGMKATLKLAQRSCEQLGQQGQQGQQGQVGIDLSTHLFLEAERRYWETRNAAGRFQKARQDALGLGWANHDHHTFRSSRESFPLLIEILLTLGWKKRERFFAGAEAGWGAQVMEQPGAGFVIFADLDLRPEETDLDFAQAILPPMRKPGTVGLWCALHGESILQAGMHHLEAQFCFDDMQGALQSSGLGTMAPFSDFSFLRQAFSQGETWPIKASRLDALLASGILDAATAERFRTQGAVGGHLENLERHEGFKGFNQQSVSSILRAVHPENRSPDGR